MFRFAGIPSFGYFVVPSLFSSRISWEIVEGYPQICFFAIEALPPEKSWIHPPAIEVRFEGLRRRLDRPRSSSPNHSQTRRRSVQALERKGEQQ